LNVAALRPSEPFKFLLEYLRVRIVEANEHTDRLHLVALLRLRREGPRHGSTADKCNEFPPSHCLTQDKAIVAG